MSSSLKNSIKQPTYTKAAILQGLRTSRGIKTMWVVVEGPDDKKTYEKFINTELSHIKTSEDKEGRRGCDNVEEIVTGIRAKGYSNVIGIRDADYLRYRNQQEVKDGVYQTDARDLEMMLLESRSVIIALENTIVGFTADITFCKSICKELGYLRIMNDVRDLGCRFQRKVNLSKIWDHTNHTLLPDWKERYEQMVIENVKEGISVTREEMAVFISTLSLSKEPEKYICRGHDIMRMFHYKRKNALDCEPKCVVEKMIKAYSFEDFSSTSLYKETDNYVKNIGFTLWAEF